MTVNFVDVGVVEKLEAKSMSCINELRTFTVASNSTYMAISISYEYIIFRSQIQAQIWLKSVAKKIKI